MKSRLSRGLCVLLAAALLLGLAALPAFAAEGALTAEEKAAALNALGLFRGKGTLADGSPDYALDDQATRSEAATMLIRLLGKESKAANQSAAGALAYPFSDPDWAAATVAWLYENGYTNGVGNGLYGGGQTITAQQFAALILRSLGYSEAKGDFSYASALDFAVAKGVLTQAQRGAWEGQFLRAGMAEMCYNALYLPARASELTLLEKLTNDGIFKASYQDAGLSGLPALGLRLLYSGGAKDSPGYAQESRTAAPCADLDGDGRKEIIFNVRDVVCINAANGSPKWRKPCGLQGGQSTIYVPTQLEDLDNDGVLEVITVSTQYAGGEGSSVQSVLTVYDPRGNVKVGPIPFYYRVHALKIADLDGDGTKEMIVGLGVGATQTECLYVYDCWGTLRSGWPQKSEYGLYGNTIEAVDLDWDGQKEIVYLFDAERMRVLNADGTLRSEFAVYESPNPRYPAQTREDDNAIAGTHGGILAADVDGDWVPELVCTAAIVGMQQVAANMAAGNNTYADNFRYCTAFLLDLNLGRYTNPAKGFDWTRFPTDTGDYVTLDDHVNLPNPDLVPAVADLDNDGNKEIVFSSYDGRVHCFSLDGTEHGAWPFAVCSSRGGVKVMASRPVAADLNGDGYQEVVFTTYPEMNAQPRQIGSLYVLDYSGRVLAQTSLPRSLDATGYNACAGGPTLADVDNDGRLEIIVSTYSAGVCVYKVS